MVHFVEAQKALREVKSGDRVYLHGGAATPRHLVDELVALAPALQDVEIVHLHTESAAPYVAEGLERSFRHNALFIGANTRSAVAEGRADYTPVFLSEIPELFAPGGSLPLDVALIQVTPPDDSGMCSLGVSVDCAHAAALHARTVIAQVNARMPRTRGAAIPASTIDHFVRCDQDLPTVSAATGTLVAAEIGRVVAGLIDDGATLQVGIGAIPDAVLGALGSHRHLGVHTEMFSNGLLPLIKSGVIDGSRKTLDQGMVVSSFVLGDAELYEFIEDNPAIELRPVTYTNDVEVISSQERMVAVNSALSVDLTGQVAADSVGARFYSGIGGQVDFIRGAARSMGGVPIIALPATAKNGTISRICAELAPGSGVVTTRGDVHWVVTEYGACNLHGQSIRRRARMLIDIAHPQFRATLEEEAYALGYLGRSFQGKPAT